MTIKYNGQDLQKRIISGKEVEKVMYNGVQIRPSSTPASDDYLCFTSLEGDNTLSLNKYGTPTEVSLEISWDKTNWIDYTIGTTIHFVNANDKLYWRSKSTIPTGFSRGIYSRYTFVTSKTFEVSGDVNYLLCKTSTTIFTFTQGFCFSYLFEGAKITTTPRLPATTLSFGNYEGMFKDCIYLTVAPQLPAIDLSSGGCYYEMFYGCTSLITAPQLPATTLGGYDYSEMFYGCTSLQQLPELPATELKYSCYHNMFTGCSSIKLSEIQTGEYQTPYRIPTNGTGTGDDALYEGMFWGTGGTFMYPVQLNTTYYTSNTVI